MASHLKNSVNPESETPKPKPSESPKKQSVLDRTWFLILMCIFFAPFGLFLLIWRKRPKNHQARIVLIVVMAVWTLIWFMAIAASHGSSQTSTTSQQAATAAAATKQAPTITSINATYNGSTEEGTVLDSSNKDIQVTASYSDGKSEDVPNRKYTVTEPVTLAAGQTSTVTITYEGASCQLSVTCTTLTEDQYKAQCAPMSYEDLARNPDSVKDSYVSVRGQVIQVQQDSGDLSLRVSITEESYGWTDPVLVAYTLPAGADNILEDDIVTVYGQSVGDYTYTSVLGASVTVPAISAKYIDITG